MKRGSSFSRRQLLGGALATFALTPWGSVAGQTPRAGWTFTDDRDITVTLPERPDRVAAQISAAAALWDYGVRPIAVFGPQRLTDGAADPRAGAVDLEQVASVGQLWGELDVERLLALDAELIVTPMWESPWLWYVAEETQAALEGKIPSLAIQTARVSIFDAIARFAALAEALGAHMTSAENVAAKAEYDAAVTDLEAAIAQQPGLRVIFVAGDDEAFYVAHPDFMSDLCFFRDLGMDVVANRINDFWETLSWEEVTTYPADLVFVDTREGSYTLEDFARVPTWPAVPAAAAGQVHDWNAEPVYSYAAYAPELRRIAEIVRFSRADVVS